MNIGHKLKQIEEKYLIKNLPEFHVGDTIKMKIKEMEGDKVRFHPFEGIVIEKTGRGLRGTFTVRKVSFGEGVERVFPIHSPMIQEIEIITKGIKKQANLYYLRQRVGKKARLEKMQTQIPTEAQASTP